MNFFAYGTLMNPKVWENVVRNRYKYEKAFLKGFSRKYLKGEEYPGIITDKNSIIEGLLYYELTHKDEKKLDLFEGEYYQRCNAEVLTMDDRVVSCYVYFLKPEHLNLLSDTNWTYNQFVKKGLETFMDKNSFPV
ncbi:MAG: gamma-glutamylcyclotransferase [Leptospiraceae bacterium]|nr:gamma-glutamylcyclotransferase [Leptospiraceae bacterium]MCP5494162.1 gamma-glutamylcyclotransferase [Leptospiraceae bacterium]